MTSPTNLTSSIQVSEEGLPVTLADCPPGPFLFNGSLGFKTEYGMTLVDENGANMPGDLIRWKVTNWPDAYCMESGECFWGGTKSHEERAKLLVQPIYLAMRSKDHSIAVDDVLKEAADLAARVRALVRAENRRIHQARRTGKNVMDCGSRDEADLLQIDLYQNWPAKRLDALLTAIDSQGK